MPDLLRAAEILQINISEEINGAAFYAALAETAKSIKVAAAAEEIAEQEKFHAQRFDKLRDRLQTDEQDIVPPKIKDDYLKWIGEQAMFTTEDAARVLAQGKSDREAVEFALKVERAAITLLTELKKYMCSCDWDVVDMTIDEEKVHIQQLNRLLNELKTIG